MRKKIPRPYLFLVLLFTGNLSYAQEWYEPSLKLSNKTADTATYNPNLHQLLVYYQRLSETEPRLWVAYYYQSLIHLKLAVNSVDLKIKRVYLDKAYVLVSFCMLNYNKNEEIRSLYAIVTMHCIDAGIFDLSSVQEQVNASLDTASVNPRMLLAYTKFLLLEPGKNRNPILLIEPRLSSLIAAAEENFRGDAYTPSWGEGEIKKMLGEIYRLK